MSSDYHARRHTGHRKMLALLIDEMHPPMIVSEEYAQALHFTDRRSIADDQGRSHGSIRTFATCLTCLGDGSEENPKWIDGETPHEPEEIDCETCRGTGLVETIDLPEPPPPAPATDDDMPF